jgi:acetyltransferase-like isoleucine patch superfamily enzyme
MEVCSIGFDTVIDPRAIIKRPHLMTIGSHCAIDAGAYFTTKVCIGSYVHIGPYVTVIGGADSELIVENFATIAAGARIICKGEEHLGWGLVGPTIPKNYSDRLVGGKVTIKQFANVLTNAVIFPGITVGEGAVIGANTVMHFDAEPWTIYLGNPARKIKVRDKQKMLAYARELINEES